MTTDEPAATQTSRSEARRVGGRRDGSVGGDLLSWRPRVDETVGAAELGAPAVAGAEARSDAVAGAATEGAAALPKARSAASPSSTDGFSVLPPKSHCSMLGCSATGTARPAVSSAPSPASAAGAPG